MNNIEVLIGKLRLTNDKVSQVKILQDINTLLLTEYQFKIDDDFVLYPLEIEAYYYSQIFEDDTVHKSDLQKNRFGKFYFHRKGTSAGNKILFVRSGIDICLSDNDAYFYGILIRSARVNNEEGIINGPQLLAQRVYRHICNNDNLSGLSDSSQSILSDFERNKVVLIHSEIRKPSTLIHSSRIGLNSKSQFSSLWLRSLTELSLSKQKQKDVLAYMEYNNIELTPDNVKKILGYTSNWIIERMKAK